MKDAPTIGIVFTCHACGVLERVVQCRERKRTETVIAWIEDVKVAVGNTHHAVSPQCRSGHVDLKIPLVDRGEKTLVGEVRRQ